MHPSSSHVCSWARRLALPVACTFLLIIAAPPGAPTSSPLGGLNSSTPPLGTTLVVPLASLGTIMAQNIAHQNNISLLQVSQEAVGDLTSQVATISVRQFNSLNGNSLEPARTLWLPTADLPWIKQANRDTIFLDQGVYGTGSMQVAQVMVQQANAATVSPVAPGTRFLLCPLSGLGQLLALNMRNINVVRINQLAVGDNTSQVALVSVSQQNAHSVQVPRGMLTPLVQLNLNLTIINQVAIGNGITQVATVDVGQDNNLTSPSS